MKTELSSLDIRAIVQELRETLVGGYIDKAYQPSYDEVVLAVTGGGRPRRKLLIHIGRFVCITSREREMPQNPRPFAMLLRKHVGKARFVDVEQLGFDRIVVFHLHAHGEPFRLVCELFRNGTVILVRGDEIVRPVTSKSWGSRDVKAGRTFQPPPSRANPTDMDFPTFVETVRASESDIVRTLAARLGLGGEYAEALLAISEHGRSTPAASLSDEELGLLYENMGMIISWLNERPKAHIIRHDGEPATVRPIELPEETGDVVQDFASFNEAVDAYFAETVAEVQADEVSDGFIGHVDRLRHQADQQRRAAEDYEREIAVNNRRGELIYANFKHCEASLIDILEAKEALGWKEVEKRVTESSLVTTLNPYDGYFVLPLTDGEAEPEGVKIRLNLTVPENAEFYYTRAKRAREKSAGALRALEETEEQLALAEARAKKAEEDGVAMVEEAARPKAHKARARHHWFERFRWTLASDGTLVVGGKDSSGNERVVKRYLKERDRYCHADFQGAPSVVVKDPGEGVSESALDEACAMAAIYSKAWSAGRASADAYWVLPEQVSKSPQTGEFVPKGAFIIRGKRNYIKDIEMRAAVGMVDHEGERMVMGGPVESVRTHSDRWVELVPSNDKKEVTAKEVSRLLGAQLDEVMPVLPPGGCRIVGKHGVREAED